MCMEPTSLRISGLSDGSEDMKEVRMVSPLLSPPLLLVLPGCGAMSSLEVAQPMTMRTTRRRNVWRWQKDGVELGGVVRYNFADFHEMLVVPNASHRLPRPAG